MVSVEIEELGSWPTDFIHLVDSCRRLILAYHRREGEIERLRQADVMARINSPPNDYRTEYKNLVASLDAALRPHRLVAYHCTRLTPEEIDDIQRTGLRVLTEHLARHRLERLVQSAKISQGRLKTISNNQFFAECLDNRHGRRTGKTWFCPNRSTLSQESGVYRLFRYWGGEAIYWSFEQDAEIASTLKSLGTPCIVRCAVPFTQAGQCHASFAERFLSEFIKEEIECPDPSAQFDLYTEQDLASSNVLEIIEFSDPRFEEFTSCASWQERHCVFGPKKD